MRARVAGERILNMIFPRRCPVCHDIAPSGHRICPSCVHFLPYITMKRCEKCGKPVEEDQVLCRDCKKIQHFYQQGLGVFRYDAIMRESMSYFKYKGRREYGELYGKWITEAAGDRFEHWGIEAVIPIPIHKRRLAERGYNQAEVISSVVSEMTGIPHLPDRLFRTEETRAMKRLSAMERAKNLRGAFQITSEHSLRKRVLLVDDIYTTGATIDAASEVLLASGCEAVFFLTVCIGSGFMVEY